MLGFFCHSYVGAIEAAPKSDHTNSDIECGVCHLYMHIDYVGGPALGLDCVGVWCAVGVMACIGGIWIQREHGLLCLSTWSAFKRDFSTMCQISIAPVMGNSLFLGQFMLIFIILAIGENALLAAGLIFRALPLMFLLFLPISYAIGQRLSFYLQLQDYDKMRRLFTQGICFMGVVGLIMAACLVPIVQQALSAAGLSVKLTNALRLYFDGAVFCYAAVGLIYVSCELFMAIRKPNIAFIINLVAYCLMFVPGALFGFSFYGFLKVLSGGRI